MSELKKLNNCWRVIQKSVIGTSHVRSGLPNQDSIDKYVSNEKSGLPLILAVSDGHGSAKSFRSDTGSRFAVISAIEVIKKIFEECFKNKNISYSLIKDELENRLPQKIVRAWREKVDLDFEMNPFTKLEISNIEVNNIVKNIEILKDNIYVVYGATLLIAVLTDSFMFYMQLGDGDILNVYEDGKTLRPFDEKDERLIANETTSLCSKDSWNEFKIKFYPLTDDFKFPELIILSTDGYSNSFRNEESFLKVGTDIWELLKNEGFEYVCKNLEKWLMASSEKSGDDITIGIIIKDHNRFKN